jgi:hypothetical protein
VHEGLGQVATQLPLVNVVFLGEQAGRAAGRAVALARNVRAERSGHDVLLSGRSRLKPRPDARRSRPAWCGALGSPALVGVAVDDSDRPGDRPQQAAALGELGRDCRFGDLATRGRAEAAVVRLLARGD